MTNASRSLSHIHNKIDGQRLSGRAFENIIADIHRNHFKPIHIASFLTACAATQLDGDEISSLIRAMVETGETMNWSHDIVLDKHCVGGLPGNRTTPIVVAIVAAAGLVIPKTSSRAITSAAGTADTMEVFCPVDLNISEMRGVVEQEGGCVVWGGNVGLSPVDDELVRVARVLEFDGREQLVASVLSKKIAAGATHVVIDIPVGVSAKIRDDEEARALSKVITQAGNVFGLTTLVLPTDGSQPVGRGIGPALEARDVVAVLTNTDKNIEDLKNRALSLAAVLLETGRKADKGTGLALARELLQSGQAWKKFQSICHAQGGFRDIPVANYTYDILARKTGIVSNIDNRLIAKLAQMTGAPEHKAAGLDLHVSVKDQVYKDQPIFTIYAESRDKINTVLDIIEVEPLAVNISNTEEQLRSCA